MIMELNYSLCSTLVALITATLFFLLYSTAKSLLSAKTLPPGPTKLPIIGNLHNLILGTSPHQTLADISKKYGPLMHLKLGEVSTLIVSSSDMAREFMKTHDLAFANRPELLSIEISRFRNSHVGFAPYGEYFRQMKKLCVTELLSSKRVQSFSTVRGEEIQKLVETIRSSPREPINLSQRLVETMSSIISRAAFGSKYDALDASTLVAAVMEGAAIVGGLSLADCYPSNKLIKLLTPMRYRIERVLETMDNTLESIITRHRSGETGEDDHQPETEDFVDVLLRIQESNLELPITNSNIKAVIIDMFGGGSETSAILIESAMAEMVKNPRVLHMAQDEVRQALKGKTTILESDIQGLTYLNLVIKETLRLHPPAPLLLPRECREACMVDGFEIPLKTRVIINGWAIGRDTVSWGDDAESFIPERFLDTSVNYMGQNFQFIPFGSGRRLCPGIPFGLANVEFTIAQLLYHFDWQPPAGMKPDDLDMTELFAPSIHRKHPLRLMATPFVPDDE